jgi:hypothetical protein
MPGSSASEKCAQECIEGAVLKVSPTLAYLLTERWIRAWGPKCSKQPHSIEPRCKGAGLRTPKAPQGDKLGCPRTIADEAEKWSALRLGSVLLSLFVIGFQRASDADLRFTERVVAPLALLT